MAQQHVVVDNKRYLLVTLSGTGAGGGLSITGPLGPDTPEAGAISVVDVNLAAALLDTSAAQVQVVDSGSQPLEYLSPLSAFNSKGQNALVADTAELIVAANASRIGVQLCNMNATIVAYIGDSNAVTTATGFPLAPGGLLATAPPTSQIRIENYNGPLYAIATGGTPNIAYLEW